MRWDDLRQSSNVEDVRGSTGGGRGLKIGLGGTLLALIASYFLGIDPRLILGLMDAVPNQSSAPAVSAGTPQDQPGRFIARARGNRGHLESELPGQRLQYLPPKLVLYRDEMPTACGSGSAAAGPFYCPLDRKVYLDLSFFQQLSDEFQAPGEFAEAYVLAHEVGHHVQKLLGIMDQVEAARQRMGEKQGNALQVRVELQADCFAGIFANHAQESKNIIEPV